MPEKYILERFKNHFEPENFRIAEAFITHLNDNLRLSGDEDFKIKQRLHIQLLYSMAIDLKNNLLDIEVFEKVFSKVKLEDLIHEKYEPRNLFVSAIQDYYKDEAFPVLSSNCGSLRCKTSTKYATIFNLNTAQLKFKFGTSPTKGSIPSTRLGKKIPLEYSSKTLAELNFSEKELNKIGLGLYWLTSLDLIEEIKVESYKKGISPADLALDILGLPHYNNPGTELFYLEIPENYVTCWQPAALHGSWDWLYCFFLSYKNIDNFGRTFNVSGLRQYEEKGKERVVKTIKFSKESDKNEFIIHYLGKVDGCTPSTNIIADFRKVGDLRLN